MPNTREKLIELIRDAKFDVDRICVERDWCDGCPVAYGEGDCKEAYIADHLIANGVTVQEWISVKDRLPEHKGNYLGFTGSTTMVGYYKGNGIWWVWLNDTEGENLFTHWMPLPPVPEEK